MGCTNHVYVIGIGLHPATLMQDTQRLEEMAYGTSHAALAHAGVERRQLDALTLGASDELDGRPISNMLMAAPAGGYLADEIRVTDSAASALCLGYARVRAGDSQLGLVASWCKSSKTDFQTIMRLRGEPFYTRPLGIDGTVADALFAQAAAAAGGISEDEVNRRVAAAYARARVNPRGLRAAPLSAADIAASAYEALPVRVGQQATRSDGAAALVLCSQAFLRANPDCRPLARIRGAGWATDSYRLQAERLAGLASARLAFDTALRHAALAGAGDIDVFELETPNGWYEAALARAFGIADERGLSPSGGCFAQNPTFCAGLVNAVEAVLQVSHTAGPTQRDGARIALAHGGHGLAQQGSTVMIFERVEALQ